MMMTSSPSSSGSISASWWCNVCLRLPHHANDDNNSNDIDDDEVIIPHPNIPYFHICQRCLAYYSQQDPQQLRRSLCVCCGWEPTELKGRLQCHECSVLWCSRCVQRNFGALSLRWCLQAATHGRWLCFRCDVPALIGASLHLRYTPHQRLKPSGGGGGGVDLPSAKPTDCTVCGAADARARHPALQVPMCDRCVAVYNTKSREQRLAESLCLWCGGGGLMLQCFACHRCVCVQCVDTNLSWRNATGSVMALNWVQVFLRFDHWQCFECMSRRAFTAMLLTGGTAKRQVTSSTQRVRGGNVARATNWPDEPTPCTSCDRWCDVYVAHSVLHVPVCVLCFTEHALLPSSAWVRDHENKDEMCTWCTQKGIIVLCALCHRSFCKQCIVRNMGEAYYDSLTGSSDDDWACFACDPSVLMPLSTSIWRHPCVVAADHGPWAYTQIGVAPFTYKQYHTFLTHPDWTLAETVLALDGVYLYQMARNSFDALTRLPTFRRRNKSVNDILARYCQMHAMTRIYFSNDLRMDEDGRTRNK